MRLKLIMMMMMMMMMMKGKNIMGDIMSSGVGRWP